MTTENSSAVTAIDITQRLLTESIDISDVWIPMRRSELDVINAALKRFMQLDANIANMLTLLNGAAPGTPSPSSAPAYHPLPDDLAQDDTPDDEPAPDDDAAFDWPAIAEQLTGLTQYAGYFAHLAAGSLTWRKLEKHTQQTMILIVIQGLHDRYGKVTGPIYEKHRPDGMPKTTTLYSHMPFTDWVDLALRTFAGPEDAGADFRPD